MSASWDFDKDDDLDEVDDEGRERPRLPVTAGRVLKEAIEPGWTVAAECVSIDPELWFPDKGRTPSRVVLEICASCPVRRSCLASALIDVEDGIWAGSQPLSRSRARAEIARGVEPMKMLEELLDRAADTGNRRRFAA